MTRHAIMAASATGPALWALAVVYLSGPMTGKPRWNFDAFEAATTALRGLGYTVLSPHEKDLDAGFDPNGDGEGFDLRAALAWDVEAVMRADAVVVLPGWEDSTGCAIEVTVAEGLGKPIVSIEDALTRGNAEDETASLRDPDGLA